MAATKTYGKAYNKFITSYGPIWPSQCHVNRLLQLILSSALASFSATCFSIKGFTAAVSFSSLAAQRSFIRIYNHKHRVTIKLSLTIFAS